MSVDIVDVTDDFSTKLGPCEVCGSSEAKYTCPRCEVKTCCLACVNIHKKELECDGFRSKIFYKPLSKFENLDLLNDYRLLEDFTRSVQKLQTDPLKRISRALPGHLRSLGIACKKRGMRLHFLPRNFKKAIENTSEVSPNRIIFWRIEWQFIQAGTHVTSEKVPETSRLAEALSPFLDPDNKHFDDHSAEMQYYYSAGMSGICALLRVGEMENNRYHILDLDGTLRGNLMRKSIVEFPSILIILKDHKYSYDIYDSDDDTVQWKGTSVASIEPTVGLSKTPTVNPKPHKQTARGVPKNFLFDEIGSEDSSDED